MATPTEEQIAREEKAVAALNRCNSENPSPEEIVALRKYLKTTPGLWRHCGDLSAVMTNAVIEGINGTPGLKESVHAGRRVMRREFAYDASPLLEQMLIDHLILCWLRLQMAEHTYTHCMEKGGTVEQGHFWEKRLAAVQRRYLRAVETLARIRKLGLPTIQVNIGDKQVNVAGG